MKKLWICFILVIFTCFGLGCSAFIAGKLNKKDGSYVIIERGGSDKVLHCKRKGTKLVCKDLGSL